MGNHFMLSVIMTVYAQCSFTFGSAQQKKQIEYHSAESFTMVGKVMTTHTPFHRFDTVLYANLPKNVVNRLKQSGGLAISFKTNSKSIYAKWCTKSAIPSATMSDVAYRGLDLYVKKNDQWLHVGVGRPKVNETCNVTAIISDIDAGAEDYLLYLPLYDEVMNLSIGVEKEANISPGLDYFEHRILIYGSSIVQGAAASRPGMAYPARLSRSTGLNFLNLGMGGSAKMEKEVADMVAEIKADAFILDCVPNSFPKEIRQRTGYLIKNIRSKHPNAPIIVMQSLIRETSYVKKETKEKVTLQNQYIKEEVDKLEKEGIKNIHFISATDFLGHDHEGTVDGTHPNDMGFDRMINVIKPRIMEILHQNKIFKK